MNINNDSKAHEYKTCAGKNCNNVSMYLLTIVIIKQSGWFCSDCKKSLQEEGLVESIIYERLVDGDES